MACISDDVGTAVDLYSRQTFFSFDFHCNGSERIEAVFEALEPRIEYWLKVAREPSPSIKDTEQLTIPDASRPETIGAQINRLRQESQLTIEQLAEEVDVNRRTVERHLADDSRPYDRHLSAYGRVFSKCLNRKVVIRKMP
jgi:DNA-binding transcriptional ArsR family regulator